LGKIRRRKRKLCPKLEMARQILIEPFLECYGTWDQPFTDVDRIYMAFGESHREIWKRKVTQSIRIEGLWWVKNEKILTSYRIKGGRGEHIYVREDFREHTVDIEAQVNFNTDWKTNTIKNEWVCCTLTEEQYAKLEPFLEERKEPCRIKSHRRK
jgi:hypothetical protein